MQQNEELLIVNQLGKGIGYRGTNVQLSTNASFLQNSYYAFVVLSWSWNDFQWLRCLGAVARLLFWIFLVQVCVL